MLDNMRKLCIQFAEAHIECGHTWRFTHLLRQSITRSAGPEVETGGNLISFHHRTRYS